MKHFFFHFLSKNYLPSRPGESLVDAIIYQQKINQIFIQQFQQTNSNQPTKNQKQSSPVNNQSLNIEKLNSSTCDCVENKTFYEIIVNVLVQSDVWHRDAVERATGALREHWRSAKVHTDNAHHFKSRRLFLVFEG